MKEFELRLKELKDEIDLLPADDEKRTYLIEEYNDYLDELFPIVKKPLCKECEIDEKFMLEWYKKLKERFATNGYYTFEKFICKIDIVTEVKVKKVKRGGELIHSEVIKVYKGKIQSPFIFEASLSWNPQNWFEKGESCLVFLKNDCIAYGRINKMEILTYNNEKYVVCHENDPEFWGDAKITVISGFNAVVYDDVIKKIMRCAAVDC
jgi:hypothetical protein